MFALLRIRDFGLLWLAGLISIAGDIALFIALPLHVYRLTDSTVATAGVLVATFAPRVLLGSIAGVFVDHWDRKRVMLIADLIRAPLLLPIVFAPDHLVVLYTIAAVQGTIGLFFSPAEGALLPRLVGKEHLVQANALNALNDNIGLLIGPVIGATLYAAAGIGGVVLINAATYLASGILIAFIETDARPERSDPDRSGSAVRRVKSDLGQGLSMIGRNRALRVLVVAALLSGVAEGVFATLGLSPLVLDVLGGTPAQVGWIAGAQALGGFAAGLIVIRIGARLSKRWLLGGGMAGVGLCDFSSFNVFRFVPPGTPAVGAVMGIMGVAGFPVVAGSVGRQSLVQEEAPDAYRGRVFGALGSVSGLAMVIGFAAGGVLGDAIGLVPVLSVSALLRVLGGIIALVFLPREVPDEPHALVSVTPKIEGA